MSKARLKSKGLVVPFPAGADRPLRKIGDDARRGEILLFTGVRYERLDVCASEPSIPDHRNAAPRRKRR